jgi:hypothetical protein
VGNGRHYAQCGLVATKHVVQKERFIFLSYDEVTTLDNQS